jgi:hypothetical protein
MSAQADKKTCTKCGRVLPLTSFYKRPRRCKECYLKNQYLYRSKNRSLLNEKQKIYREKNYVFVLERDRNYKKQNAEKLRAESKKYYHEHKEYVLPRLNAINAMARASLSDGYICSLLGIRTSQKNTAASLIEAKREHLKLLRIVKEKRNG